MALLFHCLHILSISRVVLAPLTFSLTLSLSPSLWETSFRFPATHPSTSVLFLVYVSHPILYFL